MSVISTIETFLAARVQNQSYQYHKLLKALSKFYRIHSELIVKYNVGLETPLQQGISEPVIKGDLVYKLKEQLESLPSCPDQFQKITKR